VTSADFELAIAERRPWIAARPSLAKTAAELAAHRPPLTLGRATDVLETLSTRLSRACPLIDHIEISGDVRRYAPLITTLSVVFLLAIAALFGLMATPSLLVTTLLFMLCFAALGAGNGATFQLVPLRWPITTAVAGGMIGEIGALGGGILPNVLGMSKQHTGSYRLGWICYAALAFAILVMMRVVSRSWTKTWVGSGGRAQETSTPEVILGDENDASAAAA